VIAERRPPRAVLVCPGRGAYGPRSLGSLAAGHPLVERADELRTRHGLEALTALDAAAGFDPALHARPSNADPLTFVCSLLDAETAASDHDLTAALGSSLGWHTALALAGALAFDDAFRLVQELALAYEETSGQDGPGGEVIYPLVDADWREDPDRYDAVVTALADGHGDDGSVFASIDLGGFAVLAGDEPGIARLLRELPATTLGSRRYPLRLPALAPAHTPLLSRVAGSARQGMADLAWHAPMLTLVDGRGARWTPWSTDPSALRDYTFDQLTEPYDFASAVRVALREHAPDRLVLLGPGSSLASSCAQVVVGEGYRGIASRAAFEAAQRRAPIVLSIRH
jgi:[acyl-carrier-protein] S-malonyltransferase